MPLKRWTCILFVLSLAVACAGQSGSEKPTWKGLSSDPKWPILLVTPTQMTEEPPLPPPSADESENSPENPFSKKALGRVSRTISLKTPKKSAKDKESKKTRATQGTVAPGTTDIFLKQEITTDADTAMEIETFSGAVLRLGPNTKGWFRYQVTMSQHELWLRNDRQQLLPQPVFVLQRGQVLFTGDPKDRIAILTPHIETAPTSRAFLVTVDDRGSSLAVLEGGVLVSLLGKSPTDWHTHVVCGEQLQPDQVGLPEIGALAKQPTSEESVPEKALFFLNKVGSQKDRNYLSIQQTFKQSLLLNRFSPLLPAIKKEIVTWQRRQNGNWADFCRYRNRARSDLERSRQSALGQGKSSLPSDQNNRQ